MKLDAATRYAILAYRHEIFALLMPPATSRYLEVDLRGARYKRACLFAWVSPIGCKITTLHLDIVRLDRRTLRPAQELLIEVAPKIRFHTELVPHAALLDSETRPKIIKLQGVTWHACKPGDAASETVACTWSALDCWGLTIRKVQFGAAHYVMRCECGRVRYAKRSTMHQVKYCWVCTTQRRLRARAVAKYGARVVARQRARISDTQIAYITRRILTDGAEGQIVAAEVGCTPSAISKILARQGLRNDRRRKAGAQK